MGKKRITQLLEQLKANQQAELQNAAAIFTVAQVAVNELREQGLQDTEPIVAALPPAPVLLDRNQLLQRYGSYRGCRKAAKEQGIKFSRTPSWEQLVIALSYAETLREIFQSYLEVYPNPALQGITFNLKPQ
ncbi:MAG: hypothetical protein ACRDEA_07590 [Microcystaceae cyanobacterium]